ncbi:uncharacterized protein SAPINGB_P000857 [Magnusiomyces paraingens]|uniref:Cation-transporting P-type ATPase N-terminal domain-containing protein n=1 Tax=Magnusiomyces paraingens TaxID=2606893 RepID=A0A5E8B3C1_9ASCO|nr:uncharacterized protein SAPINGB_P000857 [Saprochaete ingens]VVT45720.1 unnamed protein product [Saprochaete ingens]
MSHDSSSELKRSLTSESQSYLEKSNSNLPEKNITFDVDIEAQRHVAFGAPLSRRPSLHRRLSDVSLQERVPAESVLPIAFQTISHQISDAGTEEHLDEKAKQFADKKWHVIEPNEVALELNTNMVSGLSESEHSIILGEIGPNVQSKPPSGIFRKIISYFFGGFGLLLMVGGILCCISWKPLGQPPLVANLVLGVILFIVFISQAGFNFIQDFSSSKVMDSIQNHMPAECKVIRSSNTFEIKVRDLVPGDIVILEMGNKVPADVRIFEHSHDLSFDRSVLTGESKPIPASVKAEIQESNYLESTCIAMQGTFCVMGTGKGIVISTGDRTVFGQIAKISSVPKNDLSPLQKEILRFIIITVSVVIFLIVLVCILWGAWLRKTFPNWITVPTLIVDIVSIAVAFIPEGLPIALTTCLIITAGVMKNKQILCKSLSVVETLGSVSVLCSDKTGTLTKNKMFVTAGTIGIEELDAFREEDNDTETKLHQIEGMQLFHAVTGLCNTSSFDPRTIHLPLKERVIFSNATDQAIFRFAEKVGSTEKLRNLWHMMAELPFNSKVKFMARLYEPRDSLAGENCHVPKGSLLFTIKGAPDILFENCSHYLQGNEIVEFDEETKSKIMKIQQDWASQGQRVVLLASKVVQNNKPQDFWLEQRDASDYLTSLSVNGLTLVGLVGITDPPKDDIFNVVNVLRGAGVRLSMVTGDFELTAVAIARKCGIITHDTVDRSGDLLLYQDNEGLIDRAVVITSTDLNTLQDEEWEVLTNYSEIVFARATPDQKLRIVEKFQAAGNVVGMTGDGVNDAPSLKKADVGIAMAEGSDVAKEASDLVLLAEFSSIIDALLYGRLVFENLRKTIAYLLPAGTFAELWAVLLNIIFGLPQALSSFNMIIICCLTDCAGAITIAYESPEKNLLKKKPRSISKERLVDFKLFLHSYFTVGTYYTFASMLVCFIHFQRKGIPFSALTLSYGNFKDGISAEEVARIGEQASSVYFINLVIMQFFNLMAVRTRYLSIFQHPPIFNKETQNLLMFAAMAFALGVTFLFNYIPWFHRVVGTSHVQVEYYFIAVGFGSMLLAYDEIRKYFVRKYPEGFLAKIAW